MTRSGNHVICYVYGKKHYTNKFPDREESAPKKKAEKADDTANK